MEEMGKKTERELKERNGCGGIGKGKERTTKLEERMEGMGRELNGT